MPRASQNGQRSFDKIFEVETDEISRGIVKKELDVVSLQKLEMAAFFLKMN